MITGGKVIILIAVNIEETTISSTRNGSAIMNPIWKAVFNSLITKAGIAA
jgi:hypothetical protein